MTRELFVDLGRREFLRHGFRDASLRAMVKDAGYTLGAFYRYWPSKEALFDELVEAPAKALMDLYICDHEEFHAMSPEQQLCQMECVSRSGMDNAMRLMLQDRDAFKLLFCRSAGSRWEDYCDRLIAVDEQASLCFAESVRHVKGGASPVDRSLIHIIAAAEFQALVEIVEQDLSPEQALVLTAHVHDFQSAGWQRLLEGAGQTANSAVAIPPQSVL